MRSNCMRVAICEDDKVTIEYLAGSVLKCFNELNTYAEIVTYTKGEDFLKSPNNYDLIFLNCRLSDINGIEIAKRIRLHNSKTAIIFVTAYDEYVYESFEVNAFRYLLKPINEESLKNAISAFIKAYENETFIAVPYDKKMVTLNDDEVIYIEANEKHSIVRTLDTSYDSYKSISKYQESIKSSHFFRTHRRFLVNMKYIMEIDGNIITLTNGEKVEVSRRNMKIFNKCYMNFLKYSA